MKRTHILLFALLVVLGAACVPLFGLPTSSSQPTAEVIKLLPRVHDAGVNPDPSPARQARWDARHRYLLRKRFLATKRRLAHQRYEAQLRAWQLYESTTTTTQPYVPPTTTTVPYVAPTTQPYVAPSYSGGGYVDPASLLYPWSCIVATESGGYNVWNTQGSSASGYFQILTSTWDSIPGSPGGSAIDYSFSEQFAMAQALYSETGGSAWADGC